MACLQGEEHFLFLKKRGEQEEGVEIEKNKHLV